MGHGTLTPDSSASDLSLPSSRAAWDRFDAKAAALGASVHHVAREDDAARLVLAAASDAVATGGLVQRFPTLARQVAASVDPLAPRQAAAEVVGKAALAVAETGSVLVIGSNVDRAASLLAERLWLVVAADDLVATLDEALRRVGDLIGQGDNPYVTFMSGPSRTADIERTLTTGVHGPRALAIVVVDVA